jgi:hypothetical protein
MRTDTAVYFQTTTPGAYDATTGNYGKPTVEEVKKYASVTDSGVETLNLVYGEIRQGSKVVRLNGQYNASFDHIRIGRKVYRVDMARPLRNKHVFVVSEVQ